MKRKLLFAVPILALLVLSGCKGSDPAVNQVTVVPLLARVGSLESRVGTLENQIGRVDEKKLEAEITQLRTELNALKAAMGK